MTHADIKSLLSRSGLCLGLVLAFGCYGARETVPMSTPMNTSASTSTNASTNASTSVAMNSTDRATVRQLETAIAETIIQGILHDYPTLKASQRLDYLHQKYTQLQRSVNFQRVNATIRRQRDILAWLLAQEEENAHAPPNYLSRLNRLTSLHWSLADYKKAVTEDAARLEQAITDWQHRAGARAKTATNTIAKTTTNTATQPRLSYPEDGREGRQDYLDRLVEAMTDSPFRGQQTPEVYPQSAIGLEGIEDRSSPWIFVYESATGTLLINLAEVKNLPWFELPSVALYYGFPGLHALQDDTQDAPRLQKSLQRLIPLPGVSLGWAAYIAEFLILGETDKAPPREPRAVLHHLYFQQLLTGLALVDFQLHQEGASAWTIDEALTYLSQHTVYESSRLESMVQEVRAKPGMYLAALGGKQAFADLQKRWLQKRWLQQLELQKPELPQPELPQLCSQQPAECDLKGLHQTIIGMGAVPFALLHDTLGLP